MTPADLPYDVCVRRANGVELEVAVAGAKDGPLVILLHGFPDLWQGWHFQMPPLRDAGYRLLVPNQRGYARSGKPSGIASYDLDVLAQDAVALADTEGRSTFRLIGHDWGGIVAWRVASLFPERVERLAILNAPHPGVFKRYVFRSPSQMLKSWYAAAFQLPWLPETALRAFGHAALFRAVQRTSLPGVFDDSDRRYLAAGWSEAGSLTSMLNYYRAFARRWSQSMQQRIAAPTLILWGRRDPTEEPGLAFASAGMCVCARVELLEQAKHWIQREAHERVNRELLAFLKEPAIGGFAQDPPPSLGRETDG